MANSLDALHLFGPMVASGIGAGITSALIHRNVKNSVPISNMPVSEQAANFVSTLPVHIFGESLKITRILPATVLGLAADHLHNVNHVAPFSLLNVLLMPLGAVMGLMFYQFDRFFIKLKVERTEIAMTTAAGLAAGGFLAFLANS